MASDANLIRGEKELRRMAGVGAVNSMQAAGKTIADSWKVISDERDAIDKKAQEYIDGGEFAVDKYGISDDMRPLVSAWSVEHRNKAAATSMRTATLKGKRRAEARESLNETSTSFVNFRGNLTSLQEGSDAFFNDFDMKNISAANDPKDLEFITNVYTGVAEKTADDQGNIFFKRKNGEAVSVKNLPKVFNKDEKIFSSVTKMINKADKDGVLLIKPESGFDPTEQELRLLLNKAGRNSIMSLAVDNIFAKGGLGLDPELVYDESRHEELVEAVAAGYDAMIRAAAKSSFDKKEVANDVSSPEGKDTDYRNYIANATNRVELMRDNDDWGELSQGNYKFKGKTISGTRRVGNYLVIIAEGDVRAKFDLGQPEAYRHIRAIVTGGIKNHWAERQALGTDWTGTVLTEQKADSKEKSSGGNTEVHVTSEGTNIVNSTYDKGRTPVGANFVDFTWENGQ